MGWGVRKGFLEEVGPDNEYVLLRAERWRDSPARRSSPNRHKEIGGRLGCWDLHLAHLTGTEGSG